MKGMFLCKHGHQDIQPAIAFSMATRITEPNEGDWKKLIKMMNFLKATKDDIATMSADDSNYSLLAYSYRQEQRFLEAPFHRAARDLPQCTSGATKTSFRPSLSRKYSDECFQYNCTALLD
jgi:hypothetical protein